MKARSDLSEEERFYYNKTNRCLLHGGAVLLVTLNNFVLIAWPRAGDVSFKCLPYHLSTVCDLLTVDITGNGESGFDSGEGA